MKDDERMVVIVKQCPFCGDINEVIVYSSDYEKWENGASARKCFPYLDPSDCEMIISGLCRHCQDVFFENDDEEPEEVALDKVIQCLEENEIPYDRFDLANNGTMLKISDIIFDEDGDIVEWV